MKYAILTTIFTMLLCQNCLAQLCCNETCTDLNAVPIIDCSFLPDSLLVTDNSTAADGDIIISYSVCIDDGIYRFCVDNPALITDTTTLYYGDGGVDFDSEDLNITYAAYSQGCNIGCLQQFSVADLCGITPSCIEPEIVGFTVTVGCPVFKRIVNGFSVGE